MAIAVFYFQMKLLSDLHWGWKITHAFVLILIFLGLSPVVLGLEEKYEVPQKDLQKGIILIDQSLSCRQHEGSIESLKSQWMKDANSEIQIFGFSKGLIHPNASGKKNGGTDLQLTLNELDELIQVDLPDWLWVISDGGFGPIEKNKNTYRHIKKYITQLKGQNDQLDYGLEALRSDPVWYIRTDTPIYVDVFRNHTGERAAVDVLCLVNGEIVGKQKVIFNEDEIKRTVEFTVVSKHLGLVRIEAALAEGQGGIIRENDRLLHQCQVIRDKIRILRVVGRPTWSSKYLRDYLVQREDIDLIDFHILRNIRDQVFASQNELALIPFPVEELFVDNIESFDLILWQNFDYTSYPFFKPEYIQNIKKFVHRGGGLWLWAGTLPWDFSRGPFKEFVPVQNKSKQVVLKEGQLVAGEDTSFFSNALVKRFEQLEKMKMNLFPGLLSAGASVVLNFDDLPLIATKRVKKGRVLQMNSDDLWKLAFEEGQIDLYRECLKRSLLWLQHHPEVLQNELKFSEEILIGEKVTVYSKKPFLKNKTLVWETVQGHAVHREALKQDRTQFNIQAPVQAGVYQVGFENEKDRALVGVGVLSGEFISEQRRRKQIQELKEFQFKEIDLQGQEPWKDIKQDRKIMRRTGKPWHVSWEYLIAMVFAFVAHWVLISRNLRVY